MQKPYVEVVAEQGARVAAVARVGPLGGRVPHMRRWTLTDVVAHLGGVHRWAAEIVSTRAWSGSGHRRGRARGNTLIDWFEVGLAQLVAVLAAADYTEPCPNFSPGSPNVVGFWARRQAHETTVHRWDAESAAGQLTPIEPELAADGVDEMLSVFRRTRGGQFIDAPLGLVTTDSGGSWRVQPAAKPGRVEIVTGAGALDGVATTVAASAEALLLAVWGRRDLDDGGFHVTGRAELARAFLPGPGLP